MESVNQPSWLEQVVGQAENIDGQRSAVGGHSSLAPRLDVEILRLRAQMRK